ncbi:unnamed protein product [Clonostachys rhizophaga]|uniref:Uncharacterized protein n=2 Tax=Clonostachys rhizophaga TaxID=160324 RepID=A0A9N9VTB7_9HYPO|nr:unnamed protein product [Clonostachys rhizophaga]
MKVFVPLFSTHKTAEEVDATEVEVAEVTKVVSDGVGVITSLEETKVEDASGVLDGVLETSVVLETSGVLEISGVLEAAGVPEASGVLEASGVVDASGVLDDSGVEDEGGVVNDSKVEDAGVGVREGVKTGVVETSERTEDGEDGEATEDRLTHLAAAPPKREPKTRAGRRSIMDLIRSGIKERREMSVGEVTNVGREFDFQEGEYHFLRTKNER